jgi:pyruvate formate lyase activating enzyme
MTTFFKAVEEKVQCLVCPHNCIVSTGSSGICGARTNIGGIIKLKTYGIISGYALDPLEKKPLYHFFPGYHVLSVGSYGCNMRCDFCQNFHISQFIPEKSGSPVMPGKLVDSALTSPKNIGIAFTYNEPVIWFEYVRDTAEAAKKAGLYTVMVSNGFVNPGPLSDIIGFIDAFNIDLKAFNSQFYKRLTGADPEPVKKALKQIVKADKHLEITTLIIPGQNDSEKEMSAEAEWIESELGPEIPLHLSRYFPMHKRHDEATPADTLERLADIASTRLKYVYTGNIQAGKYNDTNCPSCGMSVTTRTGYKTNLNNLEDSGSCRGCGKQIYRYFKPFRN